MLDSLKVLPVFLEISRICELLEKSERTLPDALLKTEEELGELISAYFGIKSYKKNTEKDLQEEVVDVLQCAISLYILINKEYPFDLATLLKAKNDKWEKKYSKAKKVEKIADDDKEITLPSLNDPEMFKIHPGQILWTQQTNPCEDCMYYKQMKNGKIFVGDSPCTWCPHSPLRVTCTTTNLDTSNFTSTVSAENVESWLNSSSTKWFIDDKEDDK